MHIGSPHPSPRVNELTLPREWFLLFIFNKLADLSPSELLPFLICYRVIATGFVPFLLPFLDGVLGMESGTENGTFVSFPMGLVLGLIRILEHLPSEVFCR